MSRIHAFEFNDLASCPEFVRDSVVEILGHGLQALDFGAIVTPTFLKFAEEAGVTAVLDLASGTGVPARLICDRLRDRAPSFLLSDLFPNVPALEAAVATHPDRLRASRTPVDATAVQPEVEHQARTIINAFHHFEPGLARAVLADAVAQRKAVFIYEGFPRNVLRILPTMPAMGPCVWLNPLRTGRDGWLKGLFTYAVPVIPLVSMWDAVVSVLRVYTKEELLALAHEAGGEDFEWDYQQIPYACGGLAVVFTGIPKERLR